MTDKESVINEINELLNNYPVYIPEAAKRGLKDALVLLKEEEAVKPKSKVRHGANAQIQHFCGNCNSMLHGKPKYCSNCGKAVKWNGVSR